MTVINTLLTREKKKEKEKESDGRENGRGVKGNERKEGRVRERMKKEKTSLW